MTRMKAEQKYHNAVDHGCKILHIILNDSAPCKYILCQNDFHIDLTQVGSVKFSDTCMTFYPKNKYSTILCFRLYDILKIS